MQKNQTVKAKEYGITLEDSESTSTDQDHFYSNRKKKCYYKIQRSKTRYEMYVLMDHITKYQPFTCLLSIKMEHIICKKNSVLCV